MGKKNSGEFNSSSIEIKKDVSEFTANLSTKLLKVSIKELLHNKLEISFATYGNIKINQTKFISKPMAN
jgi:hypothetical protein